MKKFLTVALACCIAVTGCVAFAACGSGTDYDHTIVFYSSQGDALANETDTAIANFEEKYPGWTVEHTQPGGYDDVLSKVRSDLTAGLQPDLAYCYADHVAQYLESGTVVNMNKYLVSEQSYSYTAGEEQGTVDRIGFTEEEVAQFIPGYFEEGKASMYTVPEAANLPADALITLPFVKSTELLYYNPKALETLEVDVPETWDELWDICAKAKAEWPNCTPLGYDSEANWFITMAQQMGFNYTSPTEGNHFLFNNPGAIEWLTSISGFDDNYYAKQYITTQQIYGSYTSALFIKGPEAGGLVFCIGSSGGASNQSGGDLFTTGVAPIPGVYRDADNDGTEELHAECISQGPSLVMLSGGNGATNPSEKEIMTFQFVKELLAVEFQAKFAMASGYNPMREDVYENAYYAEFLTGKDPDTHASLNATKKVVAAAANTAKKLTDRYFTSPAFVGSTTARAQMTSVVQYVLLGQKTAERALTDAVKACGGNPAAQQ